MKNTSAMVDPGFIYKRLLTYAALLLLAYIFLFPLVFMIMSSFKPEQQIFADLFSIRALLPVGDVSLKNYVSVFEKSAIETMFVNSMFITGSTVLLGLLVNSLAAFSLSRLRWKGQNFVLAAIIALLIIPFEAISVPLLMLVAHLPWIGWENGQIILENGTFIVDRQVCPACDSEIYRIKGRHHNDTGEEISDFSLDVDQSCTDSRRCPCQK
mgnify:CR=1 FL=1